MSKLFYTDITKSKYVWVTLKHSVISNCFHNIAKHCFEATFKGIKTFHVGFANNNINRTFVSYLREGNNNPHQFLYNRNIESESHAQSKISIEEGESVLVCLDSENKKLHAIHGEIHEFFSYSLIENREHWYAFGSGSTNEIANIKFNYGFTNFTNQMPDGFLPWINGVDGIVPIMCKCTNRNLCKNKNHISYFFIITIC